MSTPFIADPRRSRSLALGILVAAIVGIVLAIAIPVWMLNRHYDVALAENLDKLDRYRRIAGTRTQVARQLEAMAARDPRKFFLRGGAPALAGAEAQEAVRSLVESGGGRLITMGAPASKDDGHYRQVSVNVQLTANIFALRKILGAIEDNTPYLFVDNLSIRTQVPANFKPAPGAEPEMFVQFDVLGYALTGTR
jgi:general secretion pathway protein M